MNTSIQQILEHGLRAHEAGALQEAEAAYLAVLDRNPNQADALHFLGLLNHQVGRHEVALDLINRSLKKSKRNPFYCNHLGEVYRALGNSAEALKSYRKAINLKPDFAVAYGNMGCVLQDIGQLDEALVCYRRALQLEPDSPDALVHIGTLLHEKGENHAALEYLERALAQDPERPDVRYNLGGVLVALRRFDEALFHLRVATEAVPDRAESWAALGDALRGAGRKDAALDAYSRGLHLNPDLKDALLGKARLLQLAGQPTAAIPLLTRVLELEAECVVALNNLAISYLESGHPSEAARVFERGWRTHPSNPLLFSNWLFARSYLNETADELFLAHREYQAILDRQDVRPMVRGLTRPSEGKALLRIGYVSPDFRDHPVGALLAPVLECHDREKFEIYCYSNVQYPDEVTARLKSLCQGWRDIRGISDIKVCEQIAADEIDILIDLAGHTGDNRLPIFARKPAPVQLTWMGYFDTTGLDAVDYILADTYSLDGIQQQFTEKPWCLPDVRFCFRPPKEAPPVAPPPATLSGVVTFGSFNNIAKLSDPVIATWAMLLRELPRSRLVLKSRALHDSEVSRQLIERFRQHGVMPERIEIRAGSGYERMMAEYGDVDIALDPFPYSGGMTTLDALWMGVPVVTMKGDSIIARQSASLLHAIGLDQLVAASVTDYVHIACTLAANVTSLSELRCNLRERMCSSPLCDAPKFTRHLENAYGEIWRRWCANQEHAGTPI